MPQSTQVSGPSPYMQPYINAFMPGAFNLANQPYQQYQGPRTAPLSDIQMQALQGIQGQMGGTPLSQQAQGLLGGLMQGGGNPFMQQMIGDVTNQATRAYESATAGINNRFRNPNSFAGSRHAMMQDQANEAFARGLGGALGNLQYNAYGEGLDRQMRAAQQAQGLEGAQFSRLLQGLQAGSLPRGVQQQYMDDAYNDFREARDYPRNTASWLASLLYGAPGSQSVTQTPDPNRTSQTLGSVLALLGGFGGMGGFNFFGQPTN